MINQHVDFSFACPTPDCTGHPGEEEMPIALPDFATDPNADPKTRLFRSFYCSECESEFFANIFHEFGEFTAEIVGHPSTEPQFMVRIDDLFDIDYEHYLASFTPVKPFHAFKQSSEQLLKLVERLDPDPLGDIFYRMVFVQFVVIMEAYLGDRLATFVREYPQVTKNLATKHPALKDMSFPLQALAGNPNLVSEKVESMVKAQLYHDIDAVELLYEKALGIAIFDSPDDKGFLKTVAIQRHHCVHRNGKDNNGLKVQQIDLTYLWKVVSSIEALVNRIEKKSAVALTGDYK